MKKSDIRKLSQRSTLLAVSVAFILGLTTSLPVRAAGPTTVNLGTAESFAILAGTGITNVATSAITGNIGVSPTTGASITGVDCAEVAGTIYTVDAAGPACRVVDGPLLVTAQNDLTAAYTDAAGRTPVTTVPTELGGTTKTTGVYDSASTTFEITAGAGPLVLDAQGDASAVFIFEMNSGATGLTVGPGSTVSLVNGAQACNVFWRLNTATIDTTAVFKGNILALTSITVANGANIEGRLLARNGNVTLISDTITRPTCTTPVAATPTPSPSSAADADAAADAAANATPTLPNTGSGASAMNTLGWVIIVLVMALLAFTGYYLFHKRRPPNSPSDFQQKR